MPPHITGGLLIEIRHGQCRRNIEPFEPPLIFARQFLLIETRIVLVTPIAGSAEVGAPFFRAAAHFGSIVIVRTGFRLRARERLARCSRRNDVDQPVHGVGAVQHRARPLDDLDAGRLFRMGVEQLIDVTEAAGAQRDAVLCHEERPAPACSRQHRRAQRC